MQFTHSAGCGTLKQGSDSMKIDRARAQKAFADYAAHYNAADAKVKLKIDHTYRVAALCARIAQSLALPPEDVDLAWLSGILHDVGRFEQLRRYNTFIDAQSVSHAALSVAVLFDEGRIRDYLDDAGADALLRTAVEWHSAFRLPEALDDRTRLFCQTSHKCTLNGQEVAFTPLEFDIVWYLAKRQGNVVSSEELFEAVWKEKYLDNNNTVMAHIARIRDKMHEMPRKPKFIKTVWGVGYTIE